MCSAPWYAARSGPRSARAAGRNATPAAAISLVPAERRDRRSARATTAVPRIAASTLGRSNGKRACGIARRTIGSRANASARTTGPRRTGMRLRAAGARCGFRPARCAARRRHRERHSPTTSARARARRSGAPSLRAARCLRPCSDLSCEVSERRLQGVGGGTAPERRPVDLDERHDLADRG